MSAFDDSVAEYQKAIADLPQKKDPDASVRVLRTLLARDRVAKELANCETTAEMLDAVAEADSALKAKAGKIVEVVGSDRLVAWREARQFPAEGGSEQSQSNTWWWSLESRAKGVEWWKTAFNYFLWICIVVALSFAVESVRRFLSSEVGVLGTVLQGLVTLLVGGTLLELARQIIAIQTGKNTDWNSPAFKRRIVFASSLIGIAFVMWFLLPLVVKHYSNLGVADRQEGRLSTPITHYQRTISLEPSDAIAHYNLARAYEALTEYDKAEAEYKLAIRWDDDQAVFYDGLAHLMIAQKKDNAGSLRLLDTGLDKLEAQKQAGEFQDQENEYKRIKLSLLRNRAWVYFMLEYLTQAEDDLRVAMETKPDAAAPHCLLGQVLEKKAGEGPKSPELSQQITKAYTDCIAFSHNQRDKIEAEWFAHAQERLNQEDEAQASAGQSKTP
ncbi:MAG TPA: tetratricopeptide repeat protein [Pyrinomonadaceae bacterium]